MTNLETYTQAFVEAFEIGADQVQALTYRSMKQWDSVGHMSLMAAIEEKFDIMMDADDIIDFNSFDRGKEILRKYDVEI